MEELIYHTGTDGKQYPDTTPEEYGRVGAEHLKQLRQKAPEQYQELVVAGKLNAYLNDIEERAFDTMERIVSSMAKKDGLTEDMKDSDLMKWVGLMNNYRREADKVIREMYIDI